MKTITVLLQEMLKNVYHYSNDLISVVEDNQVESDRFRCVFNIYSIYIYIIYSNSILVYYFFPSLSAFPTGLSCHQLDCFRRVSLI